MDFEFSAEQLSLRASVRRFLADKAPLRPYVRERLRDRTGTTPEVWQGLAALGVTGLLVPEAYGGSGMGMVDMGVVLEEMGRVVHPGPFLSTAVGAVSAVVAIGNEADQADLLPGMANGRTVAALALLEDGSRGDWRSVRVVAEASGSGWRLTGAKSPVPDACAADALYVSAIAPDGLGLFVVDLPAAGIVVTPLNGIDGTRKSAAVMFDRTAAHRLGPTGCDVADALTGVVDRLLIGLVTDGVGAGEAVLDLAVSYAKERIQFDKPIGAFQAVQHLGADMLQALELARAGAYYALWAADAASPGERRRAAAMAKAFASDALFRLGANAIQVFGGIGFTWEHDAHLYYKRLLTLQEAFGGAREHLEALASLVL